MLALRYLGCAVVAVLLPACASSRTPLACPTQPTQREARVFFATDRMQETPDKASAGSLGFGAERTDPPALQLGTQQITLGPKHRIGLLDKAVKLSPARVQRTARNDSAASSQELYRTDAEIRNYVHSKVRQAVRASKPGVNGRKQVLLFVHGYNSSFDYAVLKTGQLAGDLDMVTCNGEQRGVFLAYSWPSRANLLGYLADEETVEWTQQRMVPFLEALANVAREERADLHIIAHSMGSRLVVRSLSQISLTGSVRPPLASQVVLLAPDMSRSLFDQYFQRFMPLINHLTIYVSGKDRALGLSSLLHGGHQRLGLLESTLRTAVKIASLGTFGDGDHRDFGYAAQDAAASGKIDMVDVTGGLADFIGHSYEDDEFIADLRQLLYFNTPAGTGSRSNLQPRNVRPDLFGLFGKNLRYFQLETN